MSVVSDLKFVFLGFFFVHQIFALSFAQPLSDNIRIGPGDHKGGYDSSEYKTDSLSLETRHGVQADLLSIARAQQLGLPDPKDFQELAPNAAQIALGRQLFFDRRLSRNRTMSCAMCHIPEQGFSNNELKRPIGFEGRPVQRNAPTLLNVVYKSKLFADARESKLSQQAWSPLLAPNEMNNPSVGSVIEQLHNDPVYRASFNEAFGEQANMLNVGKALAQYQQSLIAGNSAFDQYYFSKDKKALNAQEIAGFELFKGKAACVSCHRIGKNTALFTDQQLHNTGVGYQASMLGAPDTVTVQLAPGLTAQVEHSVIQRVGGEKLNDLGRYEVTQDPQDRWRYITPSLRNVAISAPYMHNGEFLTLESVVEFYNRGGQANELLSPLIQPLGLSNVEISALVAFLKTLTGSNVKGLINDAFAFPVGDTD